MSEFYMTFPEKLTKFPNFTRHLPKNARILHCLNEKYFLGFFFFGGGDSLPPSPTPMAGPQAPHQLNPAL